MKKTQTSERSNEQEIIDLLLLNNWRVHKIDVLKGVSIEYRKGSAKASTRKFTDPTAEEGQADLIAVRPWAARALTAPYIAAPRFDCLYIEVKAKGQRSKPHQRAWAEVRRRDGFIVLSDCRSWADVVQGAARFGVQVERLDRLEFAEAVSV